MDKKSIVVDTEAHELARRAAFENRTSIGAAASEAIKKALATKEEEAKAKKK